MSKYLTYREDGVIMRAISDLSDNLLASSELSGGKR
jgi:hypothetical protein